MSGHRPRPSRSETWKGGALVEDQTRMQQQGTEAPGDRTGDRANPWTVHRKEESFACSFFSVRSDTVAHGTRLHRVYNSVRMTSYGVSIDPIDDEGCTTLVGQYATSLTDSPGNFQAGVASWTRRRWKRPVWN
jgi:hypothetical protein